MSKAQTPKALGCPQYLDESADKAIARSALAPSTQAAITLEAWRTVNAELDPNELRAELQAQAKVASSNDLSRLEAMLTIQAHTLDAMFNSLARQAHRNRADYLDAADRFMRLALKAQSQCRATIQSLAEIKNPKPIAFVQQANIAAGPQQVNNGPSRAENLISANELVESGRHGDRLEQGTAGKGFAGNSSLAALGQGDGTEVTRRQGDGGKK